MREHSKTLLSASFLALCTLVGSFAYAAGPRKETGQDVMRDPTSEPENYMRWTQVTEAELNAVDPGFRRLAQLVSTGQADKRVMRRYWYLRSRLAPFDRLLPEEWRRRGVRVLRNETRNRAMIEAFEAKEEKGRAATKEAGIGSRGVWIPVGPYNIPGRMTGLARPPAEPWTLYATAADGGLWRTGDGGGTWESLTDLAATQSGGAVLLDPNDPETIYFGTGEGNFSSMICFDGIGVLKSTDGGKNWTASNHFSDSVRALAMHPARGNRIYAAGDDGCYVSEDAGASFDLIPDSTGLPTGAAATAVLIRPDNPDQVYCAIRDGADPGIYRTTDGGSSWQRLGGGLPSGPLGRISMAVSQSEPGVLIAGLSLDNGRVYRTVDGGDTWTPAGGSHVGYCGGQCWYDNVVGIDAVDPNILYAGGIGIYRSLDGGETWDFRSAGIHVDHHAFLSTYGGELITATDGGIYRSTDHAWIWDNWGLGLDTTQYYGICGHPTDDYWAFGGTQDNGSNRRRAGDDPEWQLRLSGDGGMCMTGPPGSNVVIGESQYLAINRSQDDGESFGYGADGIAADEPRPWVGILVADPSNRNNMWTGTSRIYRTLDAKATPWEPVSEELTGFSVSAIDVAPSNGKVVYVGFIDGGLYRSTRATGNNPPWTDIRAVAMPPTGVRRIRVHPGDDDTAYAVFSGIIPSRIWKTTDGGTTWIDRTGDLPDVPVNDLLIDPVDPGTLLAATDLGVFRTDDDGATWYGFSSGLPTVVSVMFSHDDPSGTIRLGTHGRSMWEWQPASATPTAVPDGMTVAGTPMTVERIGESDMRLRWDTRTCTAYDYNLFWGDLDDVAARSYSGAECNLGTAGRADVPMPVTASGSAFFVIAATDGLGMEGPHGFDTGGSPLPADGTGLCGIIGQDPMATCP